MQLRHDIERSEAEDRSHLSPGYAALRVGPDKKNRWTWKATSIVLAVVLLLVLAVLIGERIH